MSAYLHDALRPTDVTQGEIWVSSFVEFQKKGQSHSKRLESKSYHFAVK
jgi:hypothetical protein